MGQITSVTMTGINYVDDGGNPQFIDFETCYQNFLMDQRRRLGSQYMDAHKEFYDWYKSIGFRSAFTMRLWFYADPPVEFEIPTEDSFWQILMGIKKAGFRTTDGE